MKWLSPSYFAVYPWFWWIVNHVQSLIMIQWSSIISPIYNFAVSLMMIILHTWTFNFTSKSVCFTLKLVRWEIVRDFTETWWGGKNRGKTRQEGELGIGSSIGKTPTFGGSFLLDNSSGIINETAVASMPRPSAAARMESTSRWRRNIRSSVAFVTRGLGSICHLVPGVMTSGIW